MARGVRTPPKVREIAKATYAITQDYSETAERLKMAESTIRNIVDTDDDFAEFRVKAAREFIVRAWDDTYMLMAMLRRKLEETQSLRNIDIGQLTKAIRDMKASIDGAANVVINANIQNNTQVNNGIGVEELDSAAHTYLADKYGLTTDEVIHRLSTNNPQ